MAASLPWFLFDIDCRAARNRLQRTQRISPRRRHSESRIAGRGVSAAAEAAVRPEDAAKPSMPGVVSVERLGTFSIAVVDSGSQRSKTMVNL
jgi:hypothetical protein